jgi:hypothetical protein
LSRKRQGENTENAVMRIKNQKDFWAGILVIGVGLFFAGVGTQYQFGTAAKMGPGYFPTVLGVITALLGAVVSLKALSSKAKSDPIEKFDWFVLLFILGPVTLFGLLLQPMGLAFSILVLVCIASFASHEFNWKSALINAVVLIVISFGIFVYGLNLQFPLWPKFLVD